MSRTYITHDLLIKKGWKYSGWCNNRQFYEKELFTIIEHNGDYDINYNSDDWIGKTYKTYEGVMSFIKKYKH